MKKSNVFAILTLLCATVSIVLVICYLFGLSDNAQAQIIGGADMPTLIYLIETHLFRGWGLCFLILDFTFIVGSVLILFRKYITTKAIIQIIVVSLMVSILLCCVLLPILTHYF